MKRDDEQFRMSGNGLEPVSGDEGRGPRGTGFGNKKKAAILVLLVLVGGGVVAYQFLGGKSPKAAAATGTAASAGQATTQPKDIDAFLNRLENPDNDDLSVERVEQLVKEFDGYVRTRQVPLKDLKANPFSVTMPAPQQKEGQEKVRVTPEVNEAEACKQRIREAAARLVLGSVMVSDTRRVAIISGKRYTVGDTIENFRVESIESDHVRLECDGEATDLRLPTGGAGPAEKRSGDGRR